MEILRRAGLTLQYDDVEQRYRMPGPAYLPPMKFTTDEALAVMVLCHEMGSGTGLPFLEPARAAAIKLEGALPEHLRQQIRKVSGAIEIRPAAKNPLESKLAVFQQILSAIGTGCCLRIHYDSLAERKALVTRLSPYRLLFSRRSWYVIGRSSIHRARGPSTSRGSASSSCSKIRTRCPAAFRSAAICETPGTSSPSAGRIAKSASASVRWWPKTSPKSNGTRRNGSSAAPTARSTFMLAFPASARSPGGCSATGTRPKSSRRRALRKLVAERAEKTLKLYRT